MAMKSVSEITIERLTYKRFYFYMFGFLWFYDHGHLFLIRKNVLFVYIPLIISLKHRYRKTPMKRLPNNCSKSLLTSWMSSFQTMAKTPLHLPFSPHHILHKNLRLAILIFLRFWIQNNFIIFHNRE